MEPAEKRDFVTQERAQRLAKQERLLAGFGHAYGYDSDHSLAEVREQFDRLGQVRVAGRVMLIRRHGALVFASLKDQTATIQIAFLHDPRVRDLDRGDWIGVEGTCKRSDKDEPSIWVGEWRLLTKSLRPLPDKHRGLTDVDTRLRQRYLDLIVNPESRRVFDIRSAVIASVRRTLSERGFTEVETPVLDASAGGAAARPFITHHNVLDRDMYLRIALELYLKRLIVGGYDKVYEIGRIFRNEGLGYKWNPEFTMLESYEAYADYFDVAEMVERLVSGIALDVLGSYRLPYKGGEIDFAPPWRRATMHDLLVDEAGFDWNRFRDEDALRAELRRRGHDAPPTAGWGKLIDEIWSAEVEPKLIQPTFVLDYPVELSPLAKRKEEDPTLVERFEAFAGGFE